MRLLPEPLRRVLRSSVIAGLAVVLVSGGCGLTDAEDEARDEAPPTTDLAPPDPTSTGGASPDGGVVPPETTEGAEGPPTMPTTSTLDAGSTEPGPDEDPPGRDEGPPPPMGFLEAADLTLRATGTTLAEACNRENPVEERILREYGSMFIAHGSVIPPPTCLFTSQAETEAFQSGSGPVPSVVDRFGGVDVRLQTAAMEALRAADTELRGLGRSISPRSIDSARRDYDMTEELWDSRVNPGLNHWVAAGRLSSAEASRIRDLPTADQIEEILVLEAQGMWFSTDLSKTILASVAAPGSSQHISMLAFDVTQHGDPTAREVLAGHGWFQTVPTDLPHFTFLGWDESVLPDRGLRLVESGGRRYWVPDL